MVTQNSAERWSVDEREAMLETKEPSSPTIIATPTWTAPGPGTWSQDRAHLPNAVTPLLQEKYPAAFAQGFAETMAAFGVLLDTVSKEFVNGFPYTQPIPFNAPGPEGTRSLDFIESEIARRSAVADDAFSNRIWRNVLEQWDHDIKPRSLAKHQALFSVDFAKLDDEQLRSHLHDCIEHIGAMWRQHHRFNLHTLIPVGDFILHAAAWTGRPPSPLFAVFDGWSPVSGVVNPEIEQAVAALRSDLAAQSLLEGTSPAEDRLTELRSRIPEVDEYVRCIGYRIAAGFDLTNPTIVERPDIVLGRLFAAVHHNTDDSRIRADTLVHELRAEVPEEHRAEFDDLLTEGRLMYRLRDERGLYSDSSAVGLLRLALIELGKRLYARKRINFIYDSLDLGSSEIDAVLDGAPSPTADELSERVALRKALSAAGAPATLGPAPTAPPSLDGLPAPLVRAMAAFGFIFGGIGGQIDSPSDAFGDVIGIGGSAGVYEGPARIVRNFDDLLTLEDGDVLVTTATGESFNSFLHVVGAIVTDHGSFASHAAIMGREMGFPAVVGTHNGTRRIPNGALVRVDGTSGTVTILG